MVSKCANESCGAPFRYMRQGKLFPIDVEFEDASGHRQRKTRYIWLCPICAQSMKPRFNVTGNELSVRLSPIVEPTMKQKTA